MRENHTRYSLRNLPAVVKPKPSRKNAKLTPNTKKTVFKNTFFRG